MQVHFSFGCSATNFLDSPSYQYCLFPIGYNDLSDQQRLLFPPIEVDVCVLEISVHQDLHTQAHANSLSLSASCQLRACSKNRHFCSCVTWWASDWLIWYAFCFTVSWTWICRFVLDLLLQWTLCKVAEVNMSCAKDRTASKQTLAVLVPLGNNRSKP